MSSVGAAPRAAVPTSSARAEASRRNGAKSRGPKTPEGKTRSSRNALKHGLRAQKYVVLPDEDAAEFAGLEAAMLEELAPVGALQTVLARRITVAAWRLMRADRMEVEVLEFRGYGDANPGLALIRDGNGTRSFETLLRYRGAAMAEFWRALRTLKALQAEQAAGQAAAHVLEAAPKRARAPAPVASRPEPDEPERGAARRLEYVMPAHAVPGRTLHEAAAPWTPKEPETGRAQSAPAPASRTNPTAHPNPTRSGGAESLPEPSAWRGPNEPEAHGNHGAMTAHGR